MSSVRVVSVVHVFGDDEDDEDDDDDDGTIPPGRTLPRDISIGTI